MPPSRVGDNEAVNVCCPKVWRIIMRVIRKRDGIDVKSVNVKKLKGSVSFPFLTILTI